MWLLDFNVWQWVPGQDERRQIRLLGNSLFIESTICILEPDRNQTRGKCEMLHCPETSQVSSKLRSSDSLTLNLSEHFKFARSLWISSIHISCFLNDNKWLSCRHSLCSASQMSSPPDVAILRLPSEPFNQRWTRMDTDTEHLPKSAAHRG